MELKEYKLGDLIEVTRGMSLPGEFYSTEGEYIRLTCGNFDYVNNSFKENKSKDDLYYVGKIKPEFIMEKGDIITPLTEQAIGLLGSTAIIPESGKYIQSQDVAKVTCKKGMIDHDFAYYLIPSKCVKEQLSAAAQQTKIRHTSPDAIKACKVFVPPLSEQKKIASVLSALDDKIALNKKMNQKLERMAKRLYDYWFVQYDFPDKNGHPYKTTGGPMTYNQTLKREIPAGWEVKTIGDYLKIGNGRDHSKLADGLYPVYGSGGVMRYVAEYLHDGETVLFPRKGTLNNVMYRNEPLWTVDTMFYTSVLVPHSALFVFYSAKMFDFERLNTGTGVPSMTSDIIKKLPIISPDKQILEQFDKTVVKLYNQIHHNEKEISRLSEQRDKLLPLLMNGQVVVG